MEIVHYFFLRKSDSSRFNELYRELPGISQKVLTSQLRALEDDGLVSRTVYPEVPPRVEYSLTTTGMSLYPILHLLAEWSEKNS